MKKVKILTMLALFINLGLSAQSIKNPAAPAAPIVNAYISGPANVCPNDQNVAYSTSTNWSGFNYWVEFTCGGAGVIAESGSQSYIINNTGNNNTCHVNWGNSNGATSWVQVTYHWTVFFTNYSASAVQYTDIGIFPPNAISGPASICASDLSTNYNLTCPNGLPIGAYAYQWSVTNAVIVGGNTASSISMHAVNSNPIVATVSFASTCGGYSGSYSYTIPRTPSLPLGAGYILPYLLSMSAPNVLWVTLQFPAKPYSYNYHCIVTNPSATPIDHYGTVAANSAGSIQLPLLAVGSTLYVNANLGVESCGNYWNYTRGGKNGMLINGSHNRLGNWDHTADNATDLISSTGKNALVYPNPANDNFTINYFSEEATNMSIEIADITGKKVLTKNQLISKGENNINVQLLELLPGVYFLNMSNNEFSQREKIIISR